MAEAETRPVSLLFVVDAWLHQDLKSWFVDQNIKPIKTIIAGAKWVTTIDTNPFFLLMEAFSNS
jgi:hypothetical protein